MWHHSNIKQVNADEEDEVQADFRTINTAR
jgi:hypothetical protein